MKFKRLPNNFGNINYLGTGRRKPYRVRVHTGYTDDGKSKYYVVGYFDTYANALMALTDYHKMPIEREKKITFAECYEKWSVDKYPKISQSNINGYVTAFKKCQPLHAKEMINISLEDMDNVIQAYKTQNVVTIQKIKTLMQQLFDYAVKYDYVPPERDKVKYVNIEFEESAESEIMTPFTDQEIALLWELSKTDFTAKVLIILIYTGVRCNELFVLKKKDVHIEEQYFKVLKSKTSNGVRSVPIADKILPMIKFFMEYSTSDYLVCYENKQHIIYPNFRKSYFVPFCKAHNLNHTIHELRHTCISKLDSAGVNPIVKKSIVGHSKGETVTEKVYTHKTIKELLDAINLI